MKYSHLLAALAVGLGLVLALLWILPGPSHAALAQGSLAPVPPSLARQHEPVVISGSLLSNLTGCTLDEIFVYAYQGTTPIQIPFQIDERDAEGRYLALEDGQLDDNDELIFMAMDGGAWVDYPSLGARDVLITPTYVITIADPISDTHAWAYVFRSTALTRTFTADYVSFDDVNDRITSPGRYALGFNAPHGFMDYVTLGSDGPNLLDRSKLRITATLGAFAFFVNEENLTESALRVIDGPVRVTRVSTLSLSVAGEAIEGPAVYFAYHSLVVQPAAFVGPGAPFTTNYQRNSMDWNEQVVGMVLYDANNSAGVTIDGDPDVVTVVPATRWIQVTGITGTVVSVNRIPAGLGGTQSTYYRDDSIIDSGDTGDQRSYGDAGFQVEDPNSDAPAIEGQTYFLTGTMSNVGATYLANYDNPLQVSVGSVIVAPGKWFTVTAAKDTASISLGETARYTLSVAAVEGFSAPVALALQGAPSGTGFSFIPNSVTPPGMSHLTITTTASTPSGTYAMTVTSTFGQLTDTASLTLTVNPTLTLAVEPVVHTIAPGETATYTLSVATSQGFGGSVNLTLQGTPSGATYSFDPDPVTPPATSQLRITTTIPTALGTYAMTVTGTSGKVTNTTYLTLTVNPTLTLSAQPVVQALLPGETAVYTLSTVASEGFDGPVTLTLQGSPSGTSVSFTANPVTPPGTSQLYITTTTPTVPGTYPMTVTGTSDQVSATTSLTLVVRPPLTLTVQPGVHTVLPGETATYTVSVDAAEGFAAPVTLSLQGAPSKATASFNPNPVIPPGTSQVHITTTIPTVPGTYVVTVSGTTGQVSATTSLTLTVSPALTLTVQPDIRAILPGEAATYTLSVDMAEGFAAPVTLSLQGAPSGATAAFDPNPVIPSGASQLSITTMISTVPETYVMTITGTSGQVTATTSVTLTVRPALTLTVQPDVRSVLPGETAAYTLSVDAAEGFAAPVTLSLQGAPPGTSVSFDPNPVIPPGTGQLYVTATVPAVLGTHVMTITGTSGQVTATASLTLAVNPTLTLAVQPIARSVLPGETAAYTLSVAASQGFGDPTSLTLRGAPPGATVSFDPNPVVPPGGSRLHITTTVPTVPGTYAMTVTATSGQVTATTSLTLTVNPTLTLSAHPVVCTVVPGETAIYTLSVAASEGLVTPVNLSLQGSPLGTIVSFTPNPVDPPGTSRLSITTTASTADGTYVVTATGTSGALTDTVGLVLVVTPTAHPTFTLSVSPTARIATPNQAVSYTVSVSGLNGFSEPVSLTVAGLPIDTGTAWSVNPVAPDGLSILTLFVPSHPPFGDHHLQVVGTTDTQVVAKDIRLTITYLKIYMPVVMR